MGLERITIRARNIAGLRPADAPRLKRLIASMDGVKSVNVRIAPGHIEVDMIAEPGVRGLLEERLGELEPLGGGDPASLVVEQRFWEAHEVLEEAWREAGEERIRAAILAMAALAKAQEGKLEAAFRIASRIPPGAGVDRGCIEEAARRVYMGQAVDLRRCMGDGWWG